jgi:pimeloyl-ACP methyl ester carboxylesterase
MSKPHSHVTGFAPRLHYLEWNPRGARTIVLLHGNSANAWWWQPLAEAMRGTDFRLLAIDQRGHGDSEWVRPPKYGPLEYAHDLARFIAEYAPPRPFVVGHSMGGISALTFAAEYPGAARAIVAIDAAITSSDRRNHYLRRLKGLPVVNYPDLETALARFRLMPKEGEIAPATLRTIAEKSLGQTSEGRWTMKFDRARRYRADSRSAATDPRRAQPYHDRRRCRARRRVQSCRHPGNDPESPSSRDSRKAGGRRAHHRAIHRERVGSVVHTNIPRTEVRDDFRLSPEGTDDHGLRLRRAIL